MDDEERLHLEKMLHIYQRRLRPLERQEALSGPRTPPEVLIEIEDLRVSISQIETILQADGAPRPASRATKSPDNRQIANQWC